MADLTDEVVVRGRTLYAPRLACRPVRPMDYPPARLQAWNTIVANVGFDPIAYAGSVEAACEACGIIVALGPRQQEAREVATGVGLRSHVLCFICSVEQGAGDEVLMHLGNPQGR